MCLEYEPRLHLMQSICPDSTSDDWRINSMLRRGGGHNSTVLSHFSSVVDPCSRGRRKTSMP